jgi:hypothetical protein
VTCEVVRICNGAIISRLRANTDEFEKILVERSQSQVGQQSNVRYANTWAVSQANAFARYCAEDAVEGIQLSDWQKVEMKQSILVQFALNHALPISISECERSFSSAKFTLNPLRTCTKSDLFEALENWQVPVTSTKGK